MFETILFQNHLGHIGALDALSFQQLLGWADSISGATHKALTYERLDSAADGKGLSSELFDEVAEELTNKQQRLNHQLIKLTDSNFSFLTTASHLLDLAQRSKYLFFNGPNLQRQKILRFLLSNCTLYDKKLNYEVNNPYKKFIEQIKKPLKEAEYIAWCPLSVVFRMECYKNIVNLSRDVEIAKVILG